jgi:uncharacterized tellurite resistance protein B-like protein
MQAESNVKNLVKILIGAAWIDGTVQPEEREYLHRVAKEKGVADDPEIQPILHEFRAVKPEECYSWVKEYLGNRPNPERWQQLIEAISGLIYSDGTVANEEARLLTNLQNLEVSDGDSPAKESTILKTIRNLYQRWIDKLNGDL